MEVSSKRCHDEQRRLYFYGSAVAKKHKLGKNMTSNLEIPHGARLDLGSGAKPRVGYLGVDALPNEHVLCFNYADGIPCPNGWLKAINISHSLEHISHTKTLGVLKECNRALMTGGEIEIVVPHDAFWYHVNLILYCLKMEYSPDKLYGKQTNVYDYHIAGFTKTKLQRILKEAGFTNIEVRTLGKSDKQSPEQPWERFSLGWFVDSFICKSQLYGRGTKKA